MFYEHSKCIKAAKAMDGFPDNVEVVVMLWCYEISAAHSELVLQESVSTVQ